MRGSRVLLLRYGHIIPSKDAGKPVRLATDPRADGEAVPEQMPF
jgi:hypothetical protein